jgi:hypothetical protein
MIGFEAEVNGEKTCLAGVGDFGVLTTIVSWVRTHAIVAKEGEGANKLDLHIGGLKEANTGDSHITWLNKNLVVGDEIRMRIVNTDHVDEAVRIEPIDPMLSGRTKESITSD